MANNKSVKKMTATASFVQATDAASGTGAKTIADTMSIPIGSVVTACITVPSISSNSSGNSETATITVGGIDVSAALNQAAMAAGNVVTDVTGGVTTSAANIGLTVGGEAFTAGSMDIIIEYYLLD
tara:strand:- start:8671 stop:9048 length:378 start_codon:yes stop_codon:yes gene_type:complete